VTNYMLLWNNASRISGWILALLCVIYVATGFGMTGRFGLGAVIGYARASWIHTHPIMYVGLIVTLLLHGGYWGYVSMKKRRWVK
jgi:hypothetical protein